MCVVHSKGFHTAARQVAGAPAGEGASREGRAEDNATPQAPCPPTSVHTQLPLGLHVTAAPGDSETKTRHRFLRRKDNKMTSCSFLSHGKGHSGFGVAVLLHGKRTTLKH